MISYRTLKVNLRNVQINKSLNYCAPKRDKTHKLQLSISRYNVLIVLYINMTALVDFISWSIIFENIYFQIFPHLLAHTNEIGA